MSEEDPHDFKDEFSKIIQNYYTPVGECISCKNTLCGGPAVTNWNHGDLLKFGPNMEFLLCRRCAVNNPGLARLSVEMGINAFKEQS